MPLAQNEKGVDLGPPVLLDNYIQDILSSEGSRVGKFFVRHLTTGELIDVTAGGQRAAAIYVSRILFLNGLATMRWPTVNLLIDDMRRRGWSPISDLRPWCVILYAEQKTAVPKTHGELFRPVAKSVAFSLSAEVCHQPHRPMVMSYAAEYQVVTRRDLEYRPLDKETPFWWHEALGP